MNDLQKSTLYVYTHNITNFVNQQYGYPVVFSAHMIGSKTIFMAKAGPNVHECKCWEDSCTCSKITASINGLGFIGCRVQTGIFS